MSQENAISTGFCKLWKKMTTIIYSESFKYIAAIFLDKGQQQISRGSLIYEIDIGFDTQGHRIREKMWSLGERPNFGPKVWGIRWECTFWSFSESRFSPIESPNIEFPTVKRMIVHRIIYLPMRWLFVARLGFDYWLVSSCWEWPEVTLPNRVGVY